MADTTTTPVFTEKLKILGRPIIGSFALMETRLLQTEHQTINWYKDNILLQGTRYMTNNNFGHLSLYIHSTTPADHGTYSVIATNEIGFSGVEVYLDLDIHDSVISAVVEALENPLPIDYPQQHLQTEGSEGLQSEAVLNLCSTSKQSNVAGKRSAPRTLKITVSDEADEPPAKTWSIYRFEDEERKEITQPSFPPPEFIEELQPELKQHILIDAANPVDNVQEVEGEPKEKIEQIYYETLMKRDSLPEGNSVRLTCKLKLDDPTVKIVWKFTPEASEFIRQLSPDGNRIICQRSRDIITLYINNLTVDDAGVYCCTVENSSGRASTETEFLVYRQGNQDDIVEVDLNTPILYQNVSPENIP